MALAKTVMADSAKGMSREILDIFKHGSPQNRLWYVRLLGMPERLNTPISLARQVEKGLPYAALTKLQRHMSLSLRELATLTAINPRTLYRRKEEGRLGPDESDRLLRLTRIFARALELFEGNGRSALSWLYKAQRSLDGATPLEMTKTELGASEVERLIGRLEHGVFT